MYTDELEREIKKEIGRIKKTYRTCNKEIEDFILGTVVALEWVLKKIDEEFPP